MVQMRVVAVRRSVAVVFVGAAMLLIGVGQGSAQADVTAVKGSAYGYSCNVTAFGNNCSPSGPTPTVILASDASNSPQTATAASANASAGPATIFSSGQLDVSTQGSLGATGSVTSSTNIANVNASGQENFTAGNLASTCTASETGVSGSTTITGGTLQTDNGDSDPTNSIPDHPPVNVTLPASPAPNTTYTGHVHIGNTTDSFRWVFNEQVVNADGSITVNAAHQYLLGPLATGNLILGQVVCGVTVAVDTTPPQTTIDSGPSGTIATTSASFTFSSSETGSTFECKLDGPGTTTGSYSTCTSPKSYTNLANGAYTFSVRATDAANNTDPTPATRTFTVNRGASGADLSVVLSDSRDPVRVRRRLTYTVTVTNNGPGTATGVKVLTRLPKRTKFISARGATCTVVKRKRTRIRCRLGSMAPNTRRTVTIVVRAGCKPNRAATATSTVSLHTSDPVSGNNRDTETTAIVRKRHRRRGRSGH